MKYTELSRLFNLYADTEDILSTEFVSASRIIREIMQLNMVAENKENVYFSSVQDKDQTVKRKLDGKVFHFGANILTSKTSLLRQVKASDVKTYQGRARKLWECPKIVYMEVLSYYNQWINMKGELIYG